MEDAMMAVKSNDQVTANYQPDRAVIRFSGDVNADRIFNLCDEINFAIDSYYYKRVRIEIDSPGGEAKSLQYFIHNLDAWRAKGVVIETLALTSCCSAGAYMLSFGDIGHRAALPDTMLLYHNVRVTGGNEALTVNRLDSLRWSLSVTDARMLLQLLRHLYGADLPKQLFDCLYELVCCLPDAKSSIKPEELEVLGGRQVKQLLKQIEVCSDERQRLERRRELYQLLVTQLRSRIKSVPPEPFEQLQQRLQGKSEAKVAEQTLAWLYGRLEWYLQEFSGEEYIRPDRAVRNNLIDRIGEV